MASAQQPGEMWRISNQQFTALVQFNKRGQVWWAAPAVKQMERWPQRMVIEYCLNRGWKIEYEDRGKDWPFSATWREVVPDGK